MAVLKNRAAALTLQADVREAFVVLDRASTEMRAALARVVTLFEAGAALDTLPELHRVYATQASAFRNMVDILDGADMVRHAAGHFATVVEAALSASGTGARS